MKYRVALIILYDSEKRLLLQHRTPDAKLLPGHWAFFGGGLKEQEAPEEALRREALEEINHTVESPELVLEQDFKEGDTRGHLYIYVEAFYDRNKLELKLREGQGWGWFKESEIDNLKMIERDRKIIKSVIAYLENKAAVGI